ncbi:hypothetical protein WN51_03279 [Melipona quadrifasciata]|uniref:Uncharacterized protein n=1 Tax=Melipona quadrifasciata TaxID=166423 RepID=A0A0M8ZVZ4_9HYME|nr:hypothetical protein WN51_03279 [Melipona quadrifasciata]
MVPDVPITDKSDGITHGKNPRSRVQNTIKTKRIALVNQCISNMDLVNKIDNVTGPGEVGDLRFGVEWMTNL